MLEIKNLGIVPNELKLLLRPPEIKIFPWSMSSTGQWRNDSGLLELKSFAEGVIIDPQAGLVTLKDMVQWLGEKSPTIQLGAAIELTSHGYSRKATEFIQALVKANPECEAKLKGALPKDKQSTVDIFLQTSPDRFPENPADYLKRGINVSFVQ